MTGRSVRDGLLEAGRKLMARFCLANDLIVPEVQVQTPEEFGFDTCAYYRPQYIVIAPAKCASPGTAGRAWSWPGYAIDRTPYGVLQHELGHHADWTAGERKRAYWSEYGRSIKAKSGEKPLTGYCPGDEEWFAEMFRLFVTNPDLLSKARPRTFEALMDRWVTVESRPWQEVLADAPARTLEQCEKKIREAHNGRARRSDGQRSLVS